MSGDPSDQMLLEIIGIVLAHGASADAVAREHIVAEHDAVRVAATLERMPVGKITLLGKTPVGAGLRQPIGIFQHLGGDGDAIGYSGRAVRVVGATTGCYIQQPTMDIGVADRARVDVFEFVEATFGATITEGFPFVL